MRVTSQMMLSQYKSDVNDAYATMTKAMRHAYNYRAFDRPSDDPLAAAQTSDVHWQMSLNDDYSSNITNLKGVANTGEKLLQNVDGLLTEANGSTTLKAINGTMNAENRKTLATQLLSIRNDIVSQMNTKYADSYIFSGTGSTSPFELVKVDEDHPGNDKLYYRGVNVDTGLTKDEETKAADYTKTINDPGKSAADKATAQTALDGLNTAGTARLKTLAGENNYIDIGLGLTVNNGKVDSQSAYDSAMTGISFLGYGTDSNGTPQNVCSLLSKISDALKSSSGEKLLNDSELKTIKKYTDVFDKSQDAFEAGQSKVGNNIKFLDSTSDYLSDLKLNLADKDDNVEYVNPYDAIEEFYSQMYCYNASLKVGSQILQQSLMDYLK